MTTSAEANGDMYGFQQPKTNRSSYRRPWYFRCLLLYPRARVHVSSSQLSTFITFLLLCIVTISVLVLYHQFHTETKTEPPPMLIPMVQLNRGDVNKAEVLESARRALEKVTNFQNSANENIKDPKGIMAVIMNQMDKREKRQFLALEAFDIYNKEDFESLMQLGYELNVDIKNDSHAPSSLDYRSYSKRVTHDMSPDYEKICYETGFTLFDAKRPLDDEFCSRLRVLETEIKEGREKPLLTLYTWWPDPLTDPEVLSKRAVMTNWDIFRPFIVPVVLTNFRMNMAMANAHAWPCLPFDHKNEDQLPVFKSTAVDLEASFNSTFYGYAVANTMFDSSLLLTLIAIKDRLLRIPLTRTDYSKTNDYGFQEKIDISEDSVMMYGYPVDLPAVGTETFEKFEYFHNNVKNTLRKLDDGSEISTISNYIIYRGIDFSYYEPVVIEDDYLIPYLVQRSSMKNKTVVMDTTQTILSAKTHRHKSTNEWGHCFLQQEPRDLRYNRRLVERAGTGGKGKVGSMQGNKSHITFYDERNRVQIMSRNRMNYT